MELGKLEGRLVAEHAKPAVVPPKEEKPVAVTSPTRAAELPKPPERPARPRPQSQPTEPIEPVGSRSGNGTAHLGEAKDMAAYIRLRGAGVKTA